LTREQAEGKSPLNGRAHATLLLAYALAPGYRWLLDGPGDN
jgi:hypothetical protein